jgi:uncharacterized protein YjbI with pentapeptide repeats
MKHRPGYSAVVSTSALLVALSGSAYASGLVTGKDVRNSSLTGKDLRDGSLTGADLAASTVGGGNVTDGSLTGADLAASTIGGGNVTDGSLTGADLAAATVTGSDVADGSLTSDDVANQSLAGRDIEDNSVAGIKIADGSLGAHDLSNTVLTGQNIHDLTHASFSDSGLPGAKIENSAAASLAPGAQSCLQLRMEVYDRLNMHAASTDHLTVPVDGTYLVAGSIQLGELDAVEAQARVVVNGQFEELSRLEGPRTRGTVAVNTLMQLEAGDQVCLGSFLTTSGSAVVSQFNGIAGLSLAVQWLAP